MPPAELRDSCAETIVRLYYLGRSNSADHRLKRAHADRREGLKGAARPGGRPAVADHLYQGLGHLQKVVVDGGLIFFQLPKRATRVDGSKHCSSDRSSCAGRTGTGEGTSKKSARSCWVDSARPALTSASQTSSVVISARGLPHRPWFQVGLALDVLLGAMPTSTAADRPCSESSSGSKGPKQRKQGDIA